MQLDELVVCVSGGDPLLLIFSIYCFSLWYEFFVHYTLRVKKIISLVLMWDLWNFHFFGPGDVSPTYSELCCFVSGSQAKCQVLFPVIILLKKFLFASAILIMSWQDVKSSLCSGVKKCGTKRAHSFLFPKSSFRIWRTTALGMFKDSAIIFDAIRRSFFTKSATAAMSTSVRVNFGWPSLSSSFTSSLLSRNREYHVKTFDQFRASFLLAFCTILVFLSQIDQLWNKILWQLSVHFCHLWCIKKTDFTRQVITCTVHCWS